MSSVSSTPRFGVSSVFFHGSGGPGGQPFTRSCGVAWRDTGGKRMTSNFSRRFGVAAASCVEMYSYGMPRSSSARRHQPSSCVENQVCISAMRGARSSCDFTFGIDASVSTCRNPFGARSEITVPAGYSFLPTVNVSSVTTMRASFAAKRSRARFVSALCVIAYAGAEG
jgi:hypothetical protein